MQSVPSQAVNSIWVNERSKLNKKHQDERDQVELRVKKIIEAETRTMDKQKTLLKERYKLHRFNQMYKGETNYGFDEDEFLHHINRGALRLRKHEMKSDFYRDLSKSIGSKSRDSYRNGSTEKSVERSKNKYDLFDSQLSYSAQSKPKRPNQESSYSDSKHVKGYTHGDDDGLTRGYTGSSIIDWRDSVFVVPKNARPTYLNKHVYPVEPSPMFSPDRSNRPRESSKEKAKQAIKEWDRSGSRSPGRNSTSNLSASQANRDPKRFTSKTPSKQNLSVKSGGGPGKRLDESTKRSQDNTESVIEIDFEEEDDVDPNNILIKNESDGKNAGQEEKVLPPIPKTEPAFEVRAVLKAFGGLLRPQGLPKKEPEPIIPAPRVEPAFETRDVLRALGGLFKPKAPVSAHSQVPVPLAPRVEPAFETRDVLRALSFLVKPKEKAQVEQKEPLQLAPRVEPAFETRDVLRALGGLLKPKTVQTSASAETMASPPKTEPAFESRELFKAMASLWKPKLAAKLTESSGVATTVETTGMESNVTKWSSPGPTNLF